MYISSEIFFFILESHRNTLNRKHVEYPLHNKFQEEQIATAFRRRSFREAIISLVISVTPHGKTQLLLDKFSWNLYRGFWLNPNNQIQIWGKSNKKKQPLYIKTYIHLYKYLVSDEIGKKRYGTAGGAEEKVANLNTEKVYKHAVFFQVLRSKIRRHFSVWG